MIKKLDECVFDALLEADVEDEVVDLVLAALAGEAALDAVLAGEAAPPRPDAKAARVAPHGAFLSQLKVRGFRGIGMPTVVNLPPGPGLTVITGRNGSGKSSLSEALECALTGTTNRWDRELGHAEFRTGWRNLHQGDPCEITVTLHHEGEGAATVRVAWPTNAVNPKDATRTYQVAGQPREETDLGWTAAVQSFRPMLSYDDLGLLLTARPSELHDSIARALDLDALTSAVVLLRDRAAPLKLPLKQAGQERRALRVELADVDDDRARAARRLLGHTSPDLTALGRLATGPTTASGPLQTCQRILAVEVTALQTVESAVRELAEARVELAGVGERRSRAAEVRDRLLSEALEYHQTAGDTECPVCGTGSLDGDWRRRTESALAENDLLLRARGEAERRHRRATEAVRQLIGAAPTILGQTDVALSSQSELVDAWGAWNDLPADSSETAADFGNQVLARYQALAQALAAWQDEARSLAVTLTERWSPYALRIAQLVIDFESALVQNAQAATLDAARFAADEIAQRLRADRLHPIVDRTKQIWQQLRQESNVRLEEIELTGRGNRRTVDIKAVVDDAAGSSALSVMSQGELNSLALALYLPRATSEDSPFRFLVLDDPVQAMDPTKVEGLAAVLSDVAKTRQVIVFSHDDRFAQAARRLPSPPTILSVRRGRQSEVIVQGELRPVERHLKDAYAVLREPNLTEAIQRRVIPGILRQAIEAAAWQRLVDERLAAGDRLDDLEQAWHGVRRTRARLELLFGSQLDGWLNREPRRRRVLAVCNRGTHQPMSGDLTEAYEDAKVVTSALANGR